MDRQQHERLALGGIRNAGDKHRWTLELLPAKRLDDLLLDRAVRNHLAAYLRKTREASFDEQEAVLIEAAQIARDKPAVAKRATGFLRIIQITREDVCTAKQHHSGFGQRQIPARLRIHDPCRHPWHH